MNKYQEALDRISTNFGECEVGSRYYDLELDKDIQTIEQDLELLEGLEQRWNKEEWCKGVPFSVDGLNSLFNYNLDLFNKNLELAEKLLNLEQKNEILMKAIESDVSNGELFKSFCNILSIQNKKLKNVICNLKRYIYFDFDDKSQEINLFWQNEDATDLGTMEVEDKEEYNNFKEVLGE